jgi:hypothetical protein
LLVNALTRSDVLGCLRCVAASVAVLLAPGYCLAWATDLLGFRMRSVRERLAWGVALSFGVMTVASVELGKYTSLSAICWLAGICAIGYLAILTREFLNRTVAMRSTRALAAFGIAIAWTAFVVAELVDIGVGDHLYLSITIFDHALRTAFVDAVLRTGIPPANPLYWPGHAAPMRYYYFWYVLTAAAARIARATARQAMIASVVWAGFGMASIVALYCRHFLDSRDAGGDLFRREGRRWSRLAIALALLGVTGLDLLPALAKAMLRLPTDGDMDWWSPDQVTSWVDSLLWVPHHIAGLVCCLFGFLLVWMSKGRRGSQRIVCGVVAGLSFASAFGLSTWVAMAFAMVMLAWMVWALWFEPRSRTRAPVLVGAGLVAIAALMPYVIELRDASPNAVATSPTASSGGSTVADNAANLLRFGVRHMIDPSCLLAFPWFRDLARSHPRAEETIAGLILLLPGYFVELGFYGLIFVVALRAMRRTVRQALLDEASRTSLVVAVAGLLAATLLRSTVVANNDFGIRSILIAQFFLLMLAVRWCEGAVGSTSRPLRITMVAMIWVGFAGTLYQVVGLRIYLPVEDRLGRADEKGLAEQAMALRVGFDQMDRRVPSNAVIQFNTDQPSDLFRFAQIMQAGRQMGMAIPACGSAFGGDTSVCGGISDGVARLFAPAPPAAVYARTECGRISVDYLVATRWDRAWGDPAGWIWTLPAVVNTPDVRVARCR